MEKPLVVAADGDTAGGTVVPTKGRIVPETAGVEAGASKR